MSVIYIFSNLFFPLHISMFISGFLGVVDVLAHHNVESEINIFSETVNIN